MATRIGAQEFFSGIHCYRHFLAFLVFFAASNELDSAGKVLEDCQVSITGERVCTQQATECQVSITGESICPQKVTPSRQSLEAAPVPTYSIEPLDTSGKQTSHQGSECVFSIAGERICPQPAMLISVNTRMPLHRVSTVDASGYQIRIGFRHGDNARAMATETCNAAALIGSACKPGDSEKVEALLEGKEKHFRSLSLGSQIMERMRLAWEFLRSSKEPHEAKIHFAHAFAAFPKSSFILRELSSVSLWPAAISVTNVPDGGGTWYFLKEPRPDQHRRQLEEFEMFSSVRFQALTNVSLAEQERELLDAGALPSEFIIDSEYDAPLQGFPFVQRHRLNHDLQLIEYLLSHGYLSADLGRPAAAAYRQVLTEARAAPLREGIKLAEHHWSLLYPFYNRRLYIHPNPAVPVGALSSHRQTRVQYGSEPVSNSAIGGELVNGGVVVIDNLLSEDALAGLRDFIELSTIFIQDRNSYLGAARHTGLASPLLAQIAEELQKAFPEFLCNLPLGNLWAFKYDDELQTGIDVHADVAAVNVNIWISSDENNLNPESGGLVVYDARVDQRSNASFDDYNKGGDWTLRNSMLRDTGYSNVTVPYRQNRAVIFDSARLHKTQDFQFKSGGVRSRRINLTLLYGARGAYCMLKRKFEPNIV